MNKENAFPNPLKLSTDSSGQSVARLQLKTRPMNVLEELGIDTIGKFLPWSEQDLKDVPNLGAGSIAELKEARTAILSATDDSGEIDWLEYARQRGAVILPEDFSEGKPPHEIVKAFPKVVRALVELRKGQREWLILQRRFGLMGSKELTLEEVGKAFSVEKQRIKQIQKQQLKIVRGAIFEGSYDDLGPWQEYRDVIVESFVPASKSGHHEALSLRPIPRQIYATSLFVEGCTEMMDPAFHPEGTRFRVEAKLTNKKLRDGGWTRPHLYSDYRKGYEVVEDS